MPGFACLLALDTSSFGRDCWTYGGASAREGRPADSLVLRSLEEVGDDAFVAAMAATYEGTRDSWVTRSIDERGTLGAARADFGDYQALQHVPDWWELAYTEDGALADVIMAARNPSTAVIAYVGVVPEQRGRGLARALVCGEPNGPRRRGG
jgi:ribosomal protein S18 acetylase RimI-like enzyme